MSKPWAVWTRDAITAAARAWALEHGAAPSAFDWRRATPTHPNESTVRRMFGTWNQMISAAGFEPRPAKRPLHGWTRRQVENAIYIWRWRHGRLPGCDDWPVTSEEHPSFRQVIDMYGSWNAAIVAAGYEPVRRYRSDDGYRKQAGHRLRVKEGRGLNDAARAAYVRELAA